MTNFDKVDMLAEAREAQWSSLAFMGPDAIKLIAPAKVNLFLAIGEKRADGYHDATTVMHALALHDNMYMNVEINDESDVDDKSGADDEGRSVTAGPADSISVVIDMVDKTCAPGMSEMLRDLEPHKNLVWRAIDLLAREIGWTRKETMTIRIEKNIPAQAGLGGGSADAAAALVGAAHFWGLSGDCADDRSDSYEILHRVASKLGADVCFFLHGACGYFTGKGEHFERRLEPMKSPIVLVKPSCGVSTADAYAAFDAAPTSIPADLLACVAGADAAVQVSLFNNLAPAASELQPELLAITEWLQAQPGVVSAEAAVGSVGAGASPSASADASTSSVLLSGSGSATFAICDTYADALRVAAAAGAHGWWARATTFSSLRAVKVG